MKLFLCSHFSSVGSLIKEEIENKKVAFIPTASLREGYTGYVGSARKLFKKLGAIVTEIDISTEAYSTIQSVFEDADVIYFTGGNSFFLIDQLRKTGTDELLKKELAKGKLMIGESAGAIICFIPSICYIFLSGQFNGYQPFSILITDDVIASGIPFSILGMALIVLVWGFFEGFNYVVICDKINRRYPTTNEWLDYGAITCAIVCILFHPFSTSFWGIVEIITTVIAIYGMLMVKKKTGNAWGCVFAFCFIWNAI